MSNEKREHLVSIRLTDKELAKLDEYIATFAPILPTRTHAVLAIFTVGLKRLTK